MLEASAESFQCMSYRACTCRYWNNVGIMENVMEATIIGFNQVLGLRI